MSKSMFNLPNNSMKGTLTAKPARFGVVDTRETTILVGGDLFGWLDVTGDLNL